MPIFEQGIKSIKIQNQFNNGKSYEVGRSVIHFKDGKEAIKCRICEIIEVGSSNYYQFNIIVESESKELFFHASERNVSVSVEYF